MSSQKNNFFQHEENHSTSKDITDEKLSDEKEDDLQKDEQKIIDDSFDTVLDHVDDELGKTEATVTRKVKKSVDQEVENVQTLFIKKHTNVYRRLIDRIIVKYGIPLTDKEIKDMLPQSSPNFINKRTYWKYIAPRNLDELVTGMNDAISNKKPIRAIGTGFGWTNIAETDNGDGLLIDTKNLNQIKEKLDDRVLSDNGKKLLQNRNIILCGSGVSFNNVNGYVWPLNFRRKLKDTKGNTYKMLSNAPGFHSLNIAGTAQVGAMGTGIRYPGIADLILSFEFLSIKDGKVVRYQIERSVNNGEIHDAKKWKEFYPEVNLIQDDEIFSNTIVSMGINGVIYSIHLQLIDAYFVTEERKIYTFEEFQKNYPEWHKQENEGTIDRMQFWFSPYDPLVPGKFYKSSPVVANIYRKTDKTPPEVINEHNGGAARGPLQSIIAGAVLSVLCSNHKVLHPLMPFVLFVSLQLTCHGELPMDAIQALNFGNANYTPTDATGIGFDESQTLTMVSEYKKLYLDFKEKYGYYITAPYALRFCKKTSGTISMANVKEPCTWIEQPLLNFLRVKNLHLKLAGKTEGEQLIYDETYKLMSNNYKGMPHWGLLFTVDDTVWKNIPEDKMNSFIKNYCTFNSSGLFSNSFTRQSGLDKIREKYYK